MYKKKTVNLVLRLPKDMHKALVTESKSFSMSLNSIIIHKLRGSNLK